MAIINMFSKKQGVTYVYESQSYWDKELHQPRSRRKLIGRRDPETGEIVPTRQKRRADAATAAGQGGGRDYEALYRQSQDTLREKEMEILRLKSELARAGRLLSRQAGCIRKAMELFGSLPSVPEED